MSTEETNCEDTLPARKPERERERARALSNSTHRRSRAYAPVHGTDHANARLQACAGACECRHAQ
eukprot:2745410-Pleurochrysis_carterae.AAC.1